MKASVARALQPAPIMPKKTKGTWTEAHQREAWARIFELSAQVIRKRHRVALRATAPLDPAIVASQKLYRDALARFGRPIAARIDREVQRVLRLVDGRLKRRSGARVRWVPGGVLSDLLTLEKARKEARQHGGARVIRVKHLGGSA